MSGVVPVEAAPDDNGVFQLEGDIEDDTPAPAPPADDLTSDDWENIYNGTDHAFVTTVGGTGMGGIVADPAPTSIYTGGGSKDDLDIDQWAWKDGQVPDKDDITNGYAAAYSQGGDTYVYFGMDRFATEGSSFVGAWLLQDDTFAPVAGSPAGSFSGQHVARDDNDTPSDPSDDSPGDVLVLSEFDEGGSGVTIKVFEWVGSGGDEGGGTLQTILGGDTGVAADCDATGSAALVCANVNTDKILNADVPWPYEAKKEKGQPVFDIPTGAFFEGGINLTDLFGTTPCFSDIVLETRSSFETNAVLKDFIASEFSLCDADIAIAPNDTNGIGEPHTFTVTVTKSVAGASTPVQGNHPVVTLTKPPNNTVVTPTTNTCDDAAGTNAQGQCTVTFTSNVATTITGHAESDVLIGDTTIHVSTGPATGQNPDAVKIFVDGSLRWLKHDDKGQLLSGAKFWVCRTHAYDSSGDGTPFDPIADTNPADGKDNDSRCQVVTDNSAPDVDSTGGEFEMQDLFLGTYTIEEKEAPAGYSKDSTVVTINIIIDDPATTNVDESAGNVTTAFVNVPLFKIIVLTCTTTGDLVDGTVKLDPAGTPDTKETLTSAPGGLTAAQVCGLGGASYSPLAANTYDLEVEVPDVVPKFPVVP